MEFVVVDRFGRDMMSTNYPQCIPYHQFDSMVAGGYKFKVDGKIVAKSKVREAVMKSLGVTELPEAETVVVDPNVAPAEKTAEVTYTKQVRCINTGEVFKNQSEAARKLGIDPAQVSDSIKTGRPRSGYTFERVAVGEI